MSVQQDSLIFRTFVCIVAERANLLKQPAPVQLIVEYYTYNKTNIPSSSKKKRPITIRVCVIRSGG